MKRRSVSAVLPMLGFVGAWAVDAEPSARVQMEVNFLLDYVEGSGCQFYRNGTWYSAHDAHVLLREKYLQLPARDRVDASEQFIERVATHSNFSGKPYLVKCMGGPTLTSNQWLREKLAQFRGHP